MDEAAGSTSCAQLDITDHPELAMIAVQGPNARAKVWAALPGSQKLTERLCPFSAVEMGKMFIARTGYTGEDGFEIMIPANCAILLEYSGRERRQTHWPWCP